MTWFNIFKRRMGQRIAPIAKKTTDTVMEDGEYRSTKQVLEELYKLPSAWKGGKSLRTKPTTGELRYYFARNPNYERAFFDKRTDKKIDTTPTQEAAGRIPRCYIKYRMVI